MHYPASWVEYEELLKDNPGSEDVRVLYAMRIGLCVMVDKKELSIDQASRYFEQLRNDLIRARKDHNNRINEAGDNQT